VVQFIAGMDDLLARARFRALRGALWGSLTQPESRAALQRRLGALLARWSPIMVGLGSPALSSAVEFARAALTPGGHDRDHNDRVGEAEAAHPAASSPSDQASIEKPTDAVRRSPLEFVAASIGLGTVAWAHALRRPRGNRKRGRVNR
jgi:hypothetical protein